MDEVLKNLDYFTEWGGKNWKNLVNNAINYLSDQNSLADTRLLDIGTRFGKMSVLFSLLGANVTGIDILEEPLVKAREEAVKWQVSNVEFLKYNGNLDIFPDQHFDVIFTKSVLVVVPNLESFLAEISKKLKPNGKIVFLENAQGNIFYHSLRVLKHRKWDFHKARFFTESEINIIRSLFQIDILKKVHFPPIYLITGKKTA